MFYCHYPVDGKDVCVYCGSVLSLVQFLFLFLCMVMCENEYKTKENKN